MAAYLGNYTKQQLQGGGRYGTRVQLGNWLEDRELDAILVKDFLARKDRGELKLDAYNRRLARGLQQVDLAKQGGDGSVRFGDTVLLKTSAGTSLACCADDADPRSGVNSCGASISPLGEAVARNTYIVVKVQPRPGSLDSTVRYSDGETLHYGQKFRLMVNPAALPDASPGPFFLKSCPVSVHHFAKLSRHQEVAFTSNETSDTVWIALTPDPTKQAVSEGVAVLAGAPVILVHCNTKGMLSAEPKAFTNDYGREGEVAAHQYTGHRHLYSLEADKLGKPAGLASKPAGEPNVWQFV